MLSHSLPSTSLQFALPRPTCLGDLTGARGLPVTTDLNGVNRQDTPFFCDAPQGLYGLRQPHYRSTCRWHPAYLSAYLSGIAVLRQVHQGRKALRQAQRQEDLTLSLTVERIARAPVTQ